MARINDAYRQSNRITTTNTARRAEILALAALVLLAMAILAGSRIAPEQRAQLFQMRSTFAAP